MKKSLKQFLKIGIFGICIFTSTASISYHASADTYGFKWYNVSSKGYATLEANVDNAPDYQGDPFDDARTMWQNAGGHMYVNSEDYSYSNVDVVEEDQQYFADHGWGTSTVAFARPRNSKGVYCTDDPFSVMDCDGYPVTYGKIYVLDAKVPFWDSDRARVLAHEFAHIAGVDHTTYSSAQFSWDDNGF